MKNLKGLRWFLVCLSLSFCLFPFSDASSQMLYRTERDREDRMVEVEEILRALETYFQKFETDRNYRIEIKEIRGHEKVILPMAPYSIEVIGVEPPHRGGDITATLRFLANGREVKRIKIRARVDFYADVIVARHFLKRHQEITKRDIQVVNKNISSLPDDGIFDVNEILGKRTLLSINRNEMIRRGMVEVPPLLKKGDRVILMVENDHFKITTLGEVREEGRRGERIKLVNLSSKREVYGRILDGNTVQIDFR